MTTNTANLIAVAHQLAVPLPGKTVNIKISPLEVLESIEVMLARLGQNNIKAGANDFIDDNGADRLLELSSELREVAAILFDAVHNHWTYCAEETLSLACKY